MKNLLLVAALAASATASADIGVRGGLETPLYTHFDQAGRSGSYSLGDTLQPALNVIVEYYPISFFGIGGEFREGFAATGSNYKRSGTSIGPNATLDLAPLPVFARAAIPLHVEPDPVTINFRLGGGVKFLILYAELLLDFPLAGSGVTAFSTQSFGAGAGISFKF